MAQKLVNIIIPAYNVQKYVGSAIKSVLAQTFKDFEIIVVDDGSSDDTKEVIHAFGDQVRYIWQENMGLGGARNAGILASNSEFIGLLDADDEWRPNFLERMMALVQSRPDAFVYYSGAQGMDSEGNDLPQIFGRMISSNDLSRNILRANFIIPSTVIFRRDIVVDVGLFDEKNHKLHGCEDWDLWLRLASSHSFAGTSESLVRYRLHSQTFSANPLHMQEAVKAVVEKNFGVDDGRYEIWSDEKRRAFGGVYRYYALTSIQKLGAWDAATESMRKAFAIDPSLAIDLDLFYELTFGSQPPGHRGTIHGFDLEQNIQLVTNMLEKIFEKQASIAALRRKTFGTANYAMGLVAYNLNRQDLSRNLLRQAIVYMPVLLLVKKAFLVMVKSYLNPNFVRKMKRFINGEFRADAAN